MNKTTPLVMALALLASSSASATLMDFNSTTLGVSSVQDSVGMSADGISVDITAFTISNDGSGTIFSTTSLTGTGGVYVSSSSDNLGVVNSTGESHNLDGSGGDEGLLFSFSQIISLDYINFDSFSGNDDFNLTVDDVLVLLDFNDSDVAGEPLVTSSPDSDEFLFSGITGKNFLFWADGGNDEFRIDRMEISAVPEPASLLLFSIGLASLGFARNKTKSNQK